MGGGRLPLPETLSGYLLAALSAFALVTGACFGRGGGDDTPTPLPTPEQTSTASPTPTPTPDPVTTPPASQLDALRWLQAALGPSQFDPPCPERITAVGVGCAAGDGNGDGTPDIAYLVPVRIPATQLPRPSAVFLRDGATGRVTEFAVDLTADSSIFGLGFFTFEDRTGDGRGDLSFLQNVCGVTGCRTRPVVQAWDGSAWRDIGPADGGIHNIDKVEWSGSGSQSAITIHGGRLPAAAPADAGPTRASTTIYALSGGRFAVLSTEPDDPDYLYHAVLDAEEIFEDDWQAAVPVFEQLATDTVLKDWQARPEQPDRRPSLRAFSLFRIALAMAALQRDPATVNAALDRVILESQEPRNQQLFVNVAQQFRKGYSERGGVIGGCAEVNLYLSRPMEGTDTRGFVTQLFNYGYANPPGSEWLQRICPF